MELPLAQIDNELAIIGAALCAQSAERAELRIRDAYALVLLLSELKIGSANVYSIYANMDFHLIEYLPDEVSQYLDWFLTRPANKPVKKKPSTKKCPKKKTKPKTKKS